MKVKEALSFKKKRDYLQAVSIFEEIVQTEGEDDFVLSNIGHCLLLAGDLEAAGEALERAYQINSENAFVLQYLAALKGKKKDYKGAAQLLSEVIRLKPGDHRSQLNMAWAWIRQREWDKAAGILINIRPKLSGDISFLKAYGYLKLSTDCHEEARKCFQEILKLRADDPWATKYLLKLKEDRSSKTDSLEEVKRLLKMPSRQTDPQMWGTYAQLLSKTGDYDTAMGAYKTALNLEPNNWFFKSQPAFLLSKLGKFEEALDHCEALLKERPQDKYLLSSYESVAIKTSQLDRAYQFISGLVKQVAEPGILYGFRRRLYKRLEQMENSEPEKVEGQRPTTRELEGCLANRFGLSGFRPGQKRIIQSVLAGRDTLAVMPTGGGKSLCYQLPALFYPHLTLIVSPLIALMKDQVDILNNRGLSAAYINSTMTPREQDEQLARVLDGKIKLLYVAPERFRQSQFFDSLQRCKVSLMAVDEAHCISHWGHDFRPDYLRLKEIRAKLSNPPVIAVTATATPEVQKDITIQLGMHGPAKFITGFERPNLAFDVAVAHGADDKLDILVQAVTRAKGSVIIYCATRKDSIKAADSLSRAGFASVPYHAGLSPEKRHQTQDDFMSGRIPIITATNAFGMGVDKADIRLVVHYSFPGSLEAYYQEAGRAGRDGKPARCLMIFDQRDSGVQEFFVEASNPSPDLIREVYAYLTGHNAARLEIAGRQIARDVSAKSEMSVGTVLKLLERWDLIKRSYLLQPMGEIRLADLFFMDACGKEGTIKRKLWEWLKVEAGGGDRMTFQFSPEVMAEELGVKDDSISRTLSDMKKTGILQYTPPFKGKAIDIVRHILPEEIPIDEKELALKKQRDLAKIDEVIKFAKSRGCRQTYMVRYFGSHSKRCGICDNCRG